MPTEEYPDNVVVTELERKGKLAVVQIGTYDRNYNYDTKEWEVGSFNLSTGKWKVGEPISSVTKVVHDELGEVLDLKDFPRVKLIDENNLMVQKAVEYSDGKHGIDTILIQNSESRFIRVYTHSSEITAKSKIIPTIKVLNGSTVEIKNSIRTIHYNFKKNKVVSNVCENESLNIGGLLDKPKIFLK